MSLSTPELVLLDLDGTLVDSIPDLAYSVNRTLVELSLPEKDINRIRNWVGNGLEKLLHRALCDDIDGIADEKLFNQSLDIFMRIYSENMCNRSYCYPGVREGISKLKERDIKLGCVTNKRKQFVEPILEKLGLLHDMSIIISGDTLPKKKPDPLPLLHAAKSLNTEPQQSIMVGDSESDVKAARAAKINIVCVSYGYNHGRDIKDTNPDAVIDSLIELPRLFH